MLPHDVAGRGAVMRASAADPGRFLQMTVDLNEYTGQGPRTVGQIGGEIMEVARTLKPMAAALPKSAANPVALDW